MADSLTLQIGVDTTALTAKLRHVANQLLVHASLAATIADLTAAITGRVLVKGTAEQTLPAITASATPTRSPEKSDA
jgi:hypothetical protein